MDDIAIRVENLSKRYRIGAREKRANTLRERLGNLAASPFDYLRRTLRGPSEDEIIWALKDVSFEVKQGEVVGIPSLRQAQYKRRAQGKHWAQRGKQNSKFQIRISKFSFHPELTGRENIYLNGAIPSATLRAGLGMKRADFQISNLQFRNSKFTGMYVRLAFAVAAHRSTGSRRRLEPEILLVGESLP